MADRDTVGLASYLLATSSEWFFAWVSGTDINEPGPEAVGLGSRALLEGAEKVMTALLYLAAASHSRFSGTVITVDSTNVAIHWTSLRVDERPGKGLGALEL